MIFSTLGNMPHCPFYRQSVVAATLGTENSEGLYEIALPFYRQSGVVAAITLKQKIDFKRGFTTLGTENSEGLYLWYRPLLFYGLAEVNTA